MFDGIVGVIISPMKVTKKAVSLILVILGVVSVFSFCCPHFGSLQSPIASAATAETQQPSIPTVPLNTTCSNAACYGRCQKCLVECHDNVAINSQSNSLNQELKNAIAVNTPSFAEIDIQRELVAKFIPPRQDFDPLNIQTRLAFLGVFIS